eukprot:286083_1
MQTSSSMRRRTKQVVSDTYSPKDKSNGMSKPLLIGLLVIGAIIVLFILYKAFSSSPSSVSSTGNNYYNGGQQENYEQEELISEEQSVASQGNKQFIPKMNMNEMFNNKMKMKRGSPFKNLGNIGNGGGDRMRPGVPGEGVPGIPEKNQRGFPGVGGQGGRGSHGIPGGRSHLPNGPNIPNMDEMKERSGFGDIHNMRGMFDKHSPGHRGKLPEELQKRFDERGDGPIFNDLNREGADKLSPQELQAARSKMRENMQNMGGRMGQQFRDGFNHRERREEM